MIYIFHSEHDKVPTKAETPPHANENVFLCPCVRTFNMAAQRLSVSSLVLCNIGMTCSTRSSASAWDRGCISSWSVPTSPALSSSSWSSSKVVMYWLITLSRSRPKVLHVEAEGTISKMRPSIPHWNRTMISIVQNWPAVLEDNVGGDSPVFHQIRDETTLHLRPLTEHRLDGYLGQCRGRHGKRQVALKFTLSIMSRYKVAFVHTPPACQAWCPIQRQWWQTETSFVPPPHRTSSRDWPRSWPQPDTIKRPSLIRLTNCSGRRYVQIHVTPPPHLNKLLHVLSWLI